MGRMALMGKANSKICRQGCPLWPPARSPVSFDKIASSEICTMYINWLQHFLCSIIPEGNWNSAY